jgi:hypothetical protein
MAQESTVRENDPDTSSVQEASHMKSAAPALIALLVAVVALAVALFRAAEAPLHAQVPLPSGGEDLGQRIASLEAEVARLGGEIALLRTTPQGTREAASGAETEGMNTRIAELEGQVTELRASRKTTPAQSNVGVREATTVPGGGQSVEEWVRTAKSGAATEQEMLLALRNLRMAQTANGKDARLDVLQEMIRLGESSQSEKARADVWRQLSGVTDRSLLQPLLHALQNDPAAKVREEAAETLGDFLPDASAHNALLFAAENDASPDVRSQCYASLGSGRR